MNGVEIGALSILVSSMVWYLKYQTKRQAKREDKHDEERKEQLLFNRNIIANELKELHKDNAKNADLNNRSIVLLEDVGSNQKKLCTLIESVDRRINGRKK